MMDAMGSCPMPYPMGYPMGYPMDCTTENPMDYTTDTTDSLKASP